MTDRYSNNVEQTIQDIESLLSNRSFQDAREASLIWEDLVESNVIDEDEAMSLGARIIHAICELEEYYEWLIDVENTIRQNWQTMQYYYIEERYISENDSTNSLLEMLAEIESEDDLVGCIMRVCEDFLKLPCTETRIKLFLSIQHRCAVAIAYWRGRGLSRSLMYEHLRDTLDSDNIPSRDYSHEPNEHQKRMGYAAYGLETMLFKSAIKDFESDYDLDSRKDMVTSVRRWQEICSKDTIDSYLNDMKRIWTDESGTYEYRRARPGEAVLVRGHMAGSASIERQTYTVPGIVDGLKVTRVERIPDIVCDILRFEEGIEEIALSDFQGSCKRLILPDSLVRIESRCFEGLSALEEVRMNGAIIGEGAFAHCENLKRVSFGPNLWSVLRGAFDGCGHLEQVDFPDSMFAIAKCAFRGCGIKKLVIHKIEQLDRQAFMDCLQLEEVRFTADIEKIHSNPFEGCTALRCIEIDDAVQYLKLRDGSLYYEKEKEISPIFRRVNGPETEILVYCVCEIPHK